MHNFKVGDKVRVHNMVVGAAGRTGTLMELTWTDADNSPNVVGVWKVKMADVDPEGGWISWFFSHELEPMKDEPLPLPG